MTVELSEINTPYARLHEETQRKLLKVEKTSNLIVTMSIMSFMVLVGIISMNVVMNNNVQESVTDANLLLNEYRNLTPAIRDTLELAGDTIVYVKSMHRTICSQFNCHDNDDFFNNTFP